MRILVTGASGSGTSTLGAALATQRGAQFLDADDYFWMPTQPPYKEKRSREERLANIIKSLARQSDSVVAGSVMEWGEGLEKSFDFVVFLQVPTAVRLDRLVRREKERFGAANPEFLEWARKYDEGPPEGRSLSKHNAWLQTQQCPVIRIVGELPTIEQLNLLSSR